jgi:aspartokinase/homoserine dehydrogenase 1
MGSINEIIVEYDLATIAVVGQNMKHVRVLPQVFRHTGKGGISVVALAQGLGDQHLLCDCQEEPEKALNIIHDSFFLSPYQELNLFVIGTERLEANCWRRSDSKDIFLKNRTS